MDRLLKCLNGNEEIKKAIPVFKEIFIEFYGEECREEIEAKFSNLLCLGYQEPESIKHYLILIRENKTRELLTPIFEKTNISLETLTCDFVIPDPSMPNQEPCGDLKFKRSLPIDNLYNLVEFHKLGKEGQKQVLIDKFYKFLSSRFEITKEEYDEIIKTKIIPEKFQDIKKYFDVVLDENLVEKEYQRLYKEAEQILKKIVPEINESNYKELLNNGKIEELYMLREEYEKAYQEFLEFDKILEPHYKELEEIDNNKSKINDEIYKDFLSKNLDLFPENRRKEIEEYISGKRTILDRKLMDIVGSNYKIITSSLIEAFSKESEEKLNNPEISNQVKQRIIEDRIKYFNIYGINLGNDYNAYINNGEAKRIIPSVERVEKFIESKKESENEFNNRFYRSLNEYQTMLLEVLQKDLVDKEIISPTMYIQGHPYVSPNIIRTEEGLQQFAAMVINFNAADGTIDHTIVHELNHVFETSLIGKNNDSMAFYCGWDIVENKICDTPKENEKKDTLKKHEIRPYELFNEVINEMIAIEISKMMHDEGIYIFDDEKNSRYEHVMAYEMTIFLIKDFFNEFKDIILKSRRNGNIQLIFDTVGKENFDALNELFNEFSKHFDSYSFRNMLMDKENSPKYGIYMELCQKRDEILENMRIHKENSMQETK